MEKGEAPPMHPGRRCPPHTHTLGSAPHQPPGPSLTPRPGHAATHPSHPKPCGPESDQAACQTLQGLPLCLSVRPSTRPLPCTRRHSGQWGRSQDECVAGDESGVASERESGRGPLQSPLRAAPGGVRGPAAWAPGGLTRVHWGPAVRQALPCARDGAGDRTEARAARGLCGGVSLSLLPEWREGGHRFPRDTWCRKHQGDGGGQGGAGRSADSASGGRRGTRNARERGRAVDPTAAPKRSVHVLPQKLQT